MSQGNSVTVDVSSESKRHSGRNMGGRNVKAPILTQFRPGSENLAAPISVLVPAPVLVP